MTIYIKGVVKMEAKYPLSLDKFHLCVKFFLSGP